MKIEKTIELLKQKSKEAVYLASLPYHNNEYIPWRRNTEDILETAFGVNSTEYKRFHDERVVIYSGIAAQEGYKTLIHRMQLEINSIIQKYERLGIEETPGTEHDQKAIEKSPIEIFDMMQFHPKIIDASRTCFQSKLYREAILNAFISLIDYVKEITGLDLDGDDLMNQVFSFNYDKDKGKITRYPIVRINKLENSTDRSEQQGFMYLYKGAAGAVRNPKAHKIIPQSNPLHTLEYLGFASLLIRILEERATLKTKSKKINEGVFIERCQDEKHDRAIYLYFAAENLATRRLTNGDFLNWGVSGYSYRMPWKTYPTGETLFIAYHDGTLQIWPDILKRKSSSLAGKQYWDKLRSIPSLAREFSAVSKHKYPTISTDRMSESDVDSFIQAIEELGNGLDELSKESHLK